MATRGDSFLADTAPRKLVLALAMVAAAAAFFQGTLSFFSFFQGDIVGLRLLLGVAAGLLALFVPAIALTKAKTRRGAALLCLALSPAAGIINSGLLFFTITVLRGPHTDTWWGVMGGLVVTTFCGSFFATPLWMIGCGIVSVLVWLVQPLVRHPAREVPDVALRRCGLWLAGAALPALLLTLTMPIVDRPTGSPVAPPHGAILAVIAVGIIVFFVGEARLRIRRLWVARVHKGAVRGWKVIPLDEHPMDVSGIPPLRHDTTDHDLVLVREQAPSSGGAYRNEGRDEPWTLLPS